MDVMHPVSVRAQSHMRHLQNVLDVVIHVLLCVWEDVLGRVLVYVAETVKLHV